MKLHALSLSILLVTGCSIEIPDSSKENTAEDTEEPKYADTEVTADEVPSGQLYLDDAEDSAVEDIPSETPEDPSVEKEIRGKALDQIARFILERSDADESGGLSLEEFLAKPKERALNRKLSDEKTDKMIAVLTADFNKHAGDDNELSLGEIKSLARDIGPRIASYRFLKHQGMHKKRLAERSRLLFDMYDKNDDGKLEPVEFHELKMDMYLKFKERREAGRERRQERRGR